ncbi:MAG: hypothetical protein CL606_00785 [Anaerolineaceae bacterium]|nr:hypothetical protein [Anaerolineaceae bacterium]
MTRVLRSRSILPLLVLWMFFLCVLMTLHFVLIQFRLASMHHTLTYSPVVVQHADAVFTHIPIVRKLLSGLPAFGDQFVNNIDTHTIAAWPRLPYYFLALVGWPIANRLDVLPVVATVLFTPLNAALMYQLVRRITGSVAVGVLGASAALTLRELFVLQPWHWTNIEEWERVLTSPFFSNALVHPQISFAFSCVVLLYLYRLIGNTDNTTYLINGILYGISFYTYFYLWTFLTVVYGAIALFLLQRRDYITLVSLAKAAGLALIISSFYWIDVMRFSGQPGFVDFQDRFSLGRYPDITERVVNLRPHLITILGLVLVVTRRRISYIYLFVLTATAELLWKIPIVIGRDYQSLHYAYHFYGPLAGITLVIGLRDLFLRFPSVINISVRRAFYIIIGLFIAIMTINRAVKYSNEYYTHFAIQSDVQEAYEFIRDNIPPGSVLLAADPEVNMRVRSIAPVYVYVPSGYGTFVTTDEMLLRHSEMLRFFDITAEQMLEYQWKDVVSSSTHYAGLLDPEQYIFNGSLRYPTTNLRNQAIVQSYSSLQRGSLTYDADIVWVGPYENTVSATVMQEREDLILIHENDSVQLYQFRLD